jgi:hypothetical protein
MLTTGGPCVAAGSIVMSHATPCAEGNTGRTNRSLCVGLDYESINVPDQ